MSDTDFPLEHLPALLRAAADRIEELEEGPDPFAAPLMLGQIRALVCTAWDVPEWRLLADHRLPTYTHPRFAAWRLAQDFTDCSTSKIGREFNRHHTTIMHGTRQAERLLIEDYKFRFRYQFCEAKLRAA